MADYVEGKYPTQTLFCSDFSVIVRSFSSLIVVIMYAFVCVSVLHSLAQVVASCNKMLQSTMLCGVFCEKHTSNAKICTYVHVCNCLLLNQEKKTYMKSGTNRHTYFPAFFIHYMWKKLIIYRTMLELLYKCVAWAISPKFYQYLQCIRVNMSVKICATLLMTKCKRYFQHWNNQSYCISSIKWRTITN